MDEATPTWRGLVLSGGGAYGEFQVGALPVLARRYQRFDFFAGVGVGALHASILAQHPDDFPAGVRALEALWEGIKGTRDILDEPWFGGVLSGLLALASDRPPARKAVFDNATLRKLADQHVRWERLAGRGNWGITLTSLTDGLVYAVSNDPALVRRHNRPPRTLELVYDDPADGRFVGALLTRFLAAAGAVPFFLPPVDVQGHHFVEGGLRDFLPLGLAVEAFALAREGRPSLEAEVLAVDNFVGQLPRRPAEALDSGQEIIARALQVMTVEMSHNDVEEAVAALGRLGQSAARLTVLRPTLDTTMNPMSFDDVAQRRALRQEGQRVAQALLATPRTW